MIADVLERLGRWSIALEDVATATLDALDYFGTVVVVQGSLPGDPVEYGDALLDLAIYGGVLRSRRTFSNDAIIGGPGMAAWLGDEDGKAATVFATAETFAADTFADTIAGLLPATVTAGSIAALAGTYSGTHQYESPRSALDYVVGLYDAHWRVNPDATVDAGAASDLFVTTPAAIILPDRSLADEVGGDGVELVSSAGNVITNVDAKDYSTDIELIGETEGTSVTTGTATTASGDIPYLDPQGNTLRLKRIINETATASGNATSRADLHLARFGTLHRDITLTATDTALVGTVRPGDSIYIYDPDAGLIDTANTVDVAGGTYYPLEVQLIALEYPVLADMTVAYRTGDGVWWDLTPYVRPDRGGSVKITAGNYPRRITRPLDSVLGRIQDATN
jgi:hypothetical protein